MTKLIEYKRDGVMQYVPGVDMAYQVYIKDYLQLDDDVLFPFISDPKVQIGRYQNAHAEVNKPYIEENNIKFSRRDTGGGAIYSDRGNTNYCFLAKTDEFSTDLNFRKMYEPVIDILHDLGVKEVKLSGRNDLEIEGRKVSGAAMTLDKDILYGGFTLMLDVDYEPMVESLNPNKTKMQAKGIKSIRNRVTGLRPYLSPEYQNLTSEQFMNLVTIRLLGVDDISQADTYVLTEEDWQAIDKLATEKYTNWEWNYGQSDRFDAIRDGRIEGIGTFQIDLTVDNARIKAIHIFGDYFGKAETSDVEDHLIGTRYEIEDIRDVLKQLNLVKYFNGNIADELAEMIVGENNH